MTLPEFLTQDDGGYIHLAGHRIGLNDIVYFYGQGDSPEMLQSRFPTIGLSLCHKVIAFYLDNQTDIDNYCEREAAEVERQRNAAPRGPSLEELRRRMVARRAVPRA